MEAKDRIEMLLNKREDLLPELQPYVSDTGHFIALRHPLLYAVPYMEQMNAMYNEQYRVKMEHLEKAKEEGKWTKYFILIERPYRIEYFNDMSDEVPDDQYWEILGWLWRDSENIWQVEHFVRDLLTAERPHREKFMTNDEHEFLASLPDQIVVYRGHQHINKMGWSWSLSFGKAVFFARRYQKKRFGIVRGIVSKKDIIGYLEGRQEFEIVIDPEHVQQVKPVKFFSKIEELGYFRKLAVSEFKLRDSDHGPEHWGQVERNVVSLCKETPEADLMVCRLFAIFHDCKRMNENDDPEHGVRASKLLKSIRSKWPSWVEPLTDEQFDKLTYACNEHNSGKTSDDPTIGVCWDADRLDIIRVGIIPEQKYFSTEAAKKLQWRI